MTNRFGSCSVGKLVTLASWWPTRSVTIMKVRVGRMSMATTHRFRESIYRNVGFRPRFASPNAPSNTAPRWINSPTSRLTAPRRVPMSLARSAREIG